MTDNICQLPGCHQKARVRGFCWPHYRELSSSYVELYEHLRSLYDEYGPLFKRAVEEVLASSPKPVEPHVK